MSERSDQVILNKCSEVFPGFDSPKYDLTDLRKAMSSITGPQIDGKAVQNFNSLLGDLKITAGSSEITNGAMIARRCMEKHQTELTRQGDERLNAEVLRDAESKMLETVLKNGTGAFTHLHKLSGAPRFTDHRGTRPNEWSAPTLTMREYRLKSELEKRPNIEVALVRDESFRSNVDSTPVYHIAIRPKQ